MLFYSTDDGDSLVHSWGSCPAQDGARVTERLCLVSPSLLGLEPNEQGMCKFTPPLGFNPTPLARLNPKVARDPKPLKPLCKRLLGSERPSKKIQNWYWVSYVPLRSPGIRV